MEGWAGGEFLLCREKTWVGVRGWGNRKGECSGLRTAPNWGCTETCVISIQKAIYWEG